MTRTSDNTVAIDLLIPSPYQPRQVFNEDEIRELADTIALHGLIQPIVVRPKGKQYEIVAGERRTRAAKLAGLTHIPCIVKAYTNEQAAAVTAVENLGRVQLNPIEEGAAYRRLIEEFHYTHDEVAAVVGKSRVKVSNCLRLLRLHHDVQDAIMQGTISEGHGKVLAGLPVEQQPELVSFITENGWSVRQLEKYLKAKPKRVLKALHAEDPDIAALTRTLSEQLGTEVDFQQGPHEIGGRLVIKYYDAETLSGLLERMNLETES